MIQPNSGNWQQNQIQLTHTSLHVGDKGEIELLRDKIKELEALLSKFPSIIESTSMANSSKNFT